MPRLSAKLSLEKITFVICIIHLINPIFLLSIVVFQFYLKAL